MILKNRLERVMVDYIKKASKELESIVGEIRNIDKKYPTEKAD